MNRIRKKERTSLTSFILSRKQALVAQVSKSAVSPTSKSAGAGIWLGLAPYSAPCKFCSSCQKRSAFFVPSVVSPPVITNQPQGTVGYWGKSASFAVAVSGSAPFSYFWYKDGIVIVGATNATLNLDDLELTNSGNYTVVVSNAFGTVTSSSAYLAVNPAGISLGLYPGVTIDGTVGKTYGIQYTTNVVQSGSWTTITNVTLTEPVFLWTDTSVNVSLGTQPQRSYRVVTVP